MAGGRRAGGGRRVGQVGDLVRAELAGLIQRELRDPKVGFVTVTAVKLSPDLRHARVFISVLAEEHERLSRQLEEASAYRDQVIARAEGEAARFTKLLAEYKKAPDVTRRRLYIEAMQDVYSSSTKVMVDVKGGNNMIYLPLDRIVKGGSGSSISNIDDLDIEELTNRVVEQLRRETQSRRREGR